MWESRLSIGLKAGAEPKLDDHSIDRETNPERDAKKILRSKVRQPACGKEYAHHRACGGDAEKDSNRPRQPPHLQLVIAALTPRTDKGKQKKAIEKQDCGTFHPSTNGVDAHRIGGNAHYKSQWKQQFFHWDL